ncbi:unnamed protein product [Rhizophagus irregularis]|uniref:Uncharacterized protein n=1 Tax=Rhizophagus irregularis TaxID=588596 RepID=A0A915ZKL5_9GLOM|nr:unnamed protein product [Rhizophagus irregularis]
MVSETKKWTTELWLLDDRISNEKKAKNDFWASILKVKEARNKFWTSIFFIHLLHYIIFTLQFVSFLIFSESYSCA